MATLADLVVRIGIDGEDIESGVDAVADRVDSAFGKITAAGLAGGAAAEGFARSQADANAALARVAAQSDASADALRGSAVEMSNHTFAASDAVRGMERLTQSGITQQAEFEELLPTFDDLADATGRDLVEGIDSAEALLGPFGKGVEDVGDNVDQMARLMTQTNVPLGSLGRNLARVPDELQALEFGLDEAAAGVEIFRDRGFEGKEAVREFRRAVEDSEGDMGEFLDTIGATADEWDLYLAAAEPVPGLASEIAASNNEQMTPMERLQQNIENLTFEYGFLADAAGQLALPLLALGPISKGVSTGLKGGIKVAKGARKAFGAIGRGAGSAVSSLGRLGTTAVQTGARVAAASARMAARAAMATGRVVAQIAIQIARWAVLGAQALIHAGKVAAAWLISLGPIALVIAAVILVAALVVANFDKIKRAVEKAFNWVKDNWPLLLAILTGPIGIAVLLIVKHWDTIREKAGAAFDWVTDKVGSAASSIKDRITDAKNWAIDRFEEVADFFTGLPGRVADAFSGLGTSIVDGIKNLWNSTIGGLGFDGFSVGPVSVPGFRIPELAEGGLITDRTLAFMGEGRFDEAVMPLPGGMRTMRGLARLAADGGRGPTVAVTVQGSVVSQRDLVEIIRDEFDRGGFGGDQ